MTAYKSNLAERGSDTPENSYRGSCSDITTKKSNCSLYEKSHLMLVNTQETAQSTISSIETIENIFDAIHKINPDGTKKILGKRSGTPDYADESTDLGTRLIDKLFIEYFLSGVDAQSLPQKDNELNTFDDFDNYLCKIIKNHGTPGYNGNCSSFLNQLYLRADNLLEQVNKNKEINNHVLNKELYDAMSHRVIVFNWTIEGAKENLKENIKDYTTLSEIRVEIELAKKYNGRFVPECAI